MGNHHKNIERAHLNRRVLVSGWCDNLDIGVNGKLCMDRVGGVVSGRGNA